MVKAIQSFAARIEGRGYAVTAGDVFEMPAGVDWVTAGLVVPLPAQPPSPDGGRETAVGPEYETAVMPAEEDDRVTG